MHFHARLVGGMHGIFGVHAGPAPGGVLEKPDMPVPGETESNILGDQSPVWAGAGRGSSGASGRQGEKRMRINSSRGIFVLP